MNEVIDMGDCIWMDNWIYGWRDASASSWVHTYKGSGTKTLNYSGNSFSSEGYDRLPELFRKRP